MTTHHHYLHTLHLLLFNHQKLLHLLLVNLKLQFYKGCFII